MLKDISDQKLLTQTKDLVKHERLTLEKVLEHLQEIQRRRLYADLGYSSLFKYLTKELKYSESAAVRRIQALKLLKKVPQVKKLIANGDLNLSVANQTQSLTKDVSP